MIKSMFGVGTSTAMLREGLTGSAEVLRETAHRVANATNGLGAQPNDPFGEVLGEATQLGSDLDGNGPQVDLEREMVELANEQIRFDAGATLLQRLYAQLRSSTRSV